MNKTSLAPTSIWDMHHHWVNEANYINRLLVTMDQLAIEKVGLISMGDLIPDLFVRHPPRVGAANNHDQAKVIKQHPDRFWGWGYIRLGHHQVSDVDQLADMGMAGLKFHVPLKPYSSLDYFPVYQRAAELGLPCLFHTGLFYPPTPLPGEGIFSENYRPIHVEPIAHEFPELKIIIAHLGVSWNQEAADLIRICPNIYADLSGRADGWRSSKPIAWFKQMLYWPTAYQKVLFGSDVHADEIQSTLCDHHRIFTEMGWTKEQQAHVFSENIQSILGV